jgi:hypothetical protein
MGGLAEEFDSIIAHVATDLSVGLLPPRFSLLKGSRLATVCPVIAIELKLTCKIGT